MASISRGKSIAGGPELPVLLTSGYADAAMREAARENVPVLRKPYDIQTLSECLGALMERRAREVNA